MSKIEYLLICLMEEAAEVQQIAAKALRFGLGNHHPDHPETTNAAEIRRELLDLDAIHTMLLKEEALPIQVSSIEAMRPKIEKVQHYMRISADLGVLKPTCEGCIYFADDMEQAYAPCRECKRLVRVNDCYRSADE